MTLVSNLGLVYNCIVHFFECLMVVRVLGPGFLWSKFMLAKNDQGTDWLHPPEAGEIKCRLLQLHPDFFHIIDTQTDGFLNG